MTFPSKARAEAWLEDHGYRRHPNRPDVWFTRNEDAVLRPWKGPCWPWSIDFHQKD